MNTNISSQDPAIPVMTMDILKNILILADNPGVLGQYLTEEIRELTGARCVLFIRWSDPAADTSHQIISVHPERRRSWAESPETYLIYKEFLTNPVSRILNAKEMPITGEVLLSEGFEYSFAIPLFIGGLQVGALFALGLPVIERQDSVIELFQTLSTIIALVLQNSFLYEMQEEIIEERTTELQSANEELMTELAGRKRAEEALQVASAYNRSLIETSIDPLVTISPDGKIQDVNSATERVTGRLRNDLIGTDFSQYFTDPEKARKGYKQVFCYGFVRDYPLEIRHTGGLVTPVLYNASVYKDMQGEIRGVFAAARDITELKKAEEKLLNLASIVENSSDAIIGKSLNGIITSWNTGAETIYGYPASEAVGMSISILIPPDKNDDLDFILQKVRNGEPISHYETTRIRKDGRSIDVSLTTSPIKDRNNAIIGVSTIARDITEKKSVEKRLIDSEKHYRSIIELNNAGYFRIGPDGKFKEVNDAWLKMHKYSSRDEIIGKHFSITQVERDLENAQKIVNILFDEKSIPSGEFSRLCKDGSVGYHSFSAEPIVKNGKITGLEGFLIDITERKHAEDALRESEERLRLTLDAANDGIWDWDLPTGSAFFSPRWYTMLGYEPDELPGTYTTWRSLLHPDDLEETEQKIQSHMLKEEEEYSVEFRMRTKQGNWSWVLARGKVIEWDEEGNPVRMVGTHTDISIRKRIQEELLASYEQLAANEEELRHNFEDLTRIEGILRESEERLLMAQEISQTGSWEYNLQTNRIWGSAEGFRIYGYPPIAGDLPIDEIEACIPERERVHQALINLISEGREYNLEFSINPVDRSAPKIIHSIAKLEKDNEGNSTRVVGVIQDVTGLKHAETVLKEINAAFVQAQKIAHVGSWMYDFKTDCIIWSDELYRVFGYEPRAIELNLDTIRKMIHPDDIEKHDRILKTAIDSHFYQPEEYRVIYPDDSIHYINTNGTVEVDEDGITVRIIGVCQEITERKIAEKALTQNMVHLEELVKERTIELQTAKDQAEKSNMAKSTFLSSMSHELRTPLNAILGFTQILIRQDNLSDTQREQLLIVKSSGDHLLNLITDLLDLGRIEAQKIEIQHSGFNLPNTIQEVMDITKVKAEEKDLTLQYEPQTLIPDHVLGDERKIKQILLNLLSNAVKYTREGGIILRVWYPDISSGLFVCEVEDSGIGIPQDKLEIIFEPFTNLSSERKPIEGAGLGLSITKNLVEMMQGTLQVRSEPGKGSTFRFEVVLPSVEVSEAPLITEDQITGYEGERKRVLVVDDNPENVALLVSMLEPLRFEMTTAYNGDEAVRMARDKIPDLVLLDLVMPEMDGLDVARVFRNDPNLTQISIIGVSATVSPSERKQEFEALCDYFVGKPIPFGVLLEKIRISLGITWNVVPSFSVYQSPEESTEKERSMVVPPEQILQVIVSLVQQGMFSELKPILTDLQTDGRYAPFCEQIHRFARNYDDERILSFISGLKERQDYHEG